MTVPSVLVLFAALATIVAGSYLLFVLPFRMRRERFETLAYELRDDLISTVTSGTIRPSHSAVVLLNMAERLARESGELTVATISIERYFSRDLRTELPEPPKSVIDPSCPDAEKLIQFEERMNQLGIRYTTTSSFASILAFIWFPVVVSVYRLMRGSKPTTGNARRTFEVVFEDDNETMARIDTRPLDHSDARPTYRSHAPLASIG
ncbi:hypothetical protein [Isoptericola sp. NPDC057191]|uniref:hypothetical protein n=1 Tax=Isoptericola sp. NPDC057191 TaxID=3346041 RepID=UPI00363029D1